MRPFTRIALVLVFIGCGVVLAKEPSKRAKQRKNPLVDPATVEASVSKVTNQIHWYASLDEARAEAKRTGKLVLWMHALGELTGTT